MQNCNSTSNLKLLIFVIVFLSFFQIGRTQSQNSYIQDTSQVRDYINQSSGILYIYPDSAFKYTDSILEISKSIDYNYGLFKGHNLKGLLYWVTNNYDSALVHYNKALVYSNNLQTKRSKAVALINLGLLFSTSYQNDSALTYMLKTLKYTKKNGFQDLYAKVMIDLGNFYLDQDNYIDATKYLVKVRDEMLPHLDSITLSSLYGSFGVLFNKVNEFDLALLNMNKALEIDEEVDEINHISNTYINIGELYFNLKNDNKSAVYYYRKAVKYALDFNKANIKLAANINLGNVFVHQMQLDSAFSYYHKALLDSTLDYYPDRKTAVLVNLGHYYLLAKDYRKSRAFLDEGLNLSNSLNIKIFSQKALFSLIQLDSIEHNYKHSVQRLKDYHKVSVKLQDTEARNKIAIIEYEKYLVQEKYNNKLLLNDNTLKNELISIQESILWVSICFVILLLGLLIIMYKGRLKNKSLNSKLEDNNEQLTYANQNLSEVNQTLKKQQELLKSLNITKDRFFSILGHDLKSPYSGLLGILQLMDNDWEQIEDLEKKQLVETLHRTAKKNYKLLEELLSWGQMQQGLIKKQDESFFLIDTVNEVIELYHFQIANKRIKLINEIPANLFINSDPQLFKQILQNLIGNAVKFTPIGGTVTILIKNTPHKVHVHIIDTGIGIPKSQSASIFNLDANFKRRGTLGENSTGMGLILSNGYAEIIGAKLSLETQEGKGSSFILSLAQ